MKILEALGYIGAALAGIATIIDAITGLLDRRKR